MSEFFDALETRSADARAAATARDLPALIAHAKTAAIGYASALADVDPAAITGAAALATLPVLRKSEIGAAQTSIPPLGGYFAGDAPHHLFQSPGPIYEPGMRGSDFWRLGRFLHAAGLRRGDVVQNCFSYHFTPAGMMFDNAAAAIGATVFPAGVGQTELQAAALAHIGATAYAGTPDFLKVILEKADELGVDTSALKHAVVGGGPLFPQLRDFYTDRGISCLQCYATADLGNIAYESAAMEGMIVDEGVIVEIVTPGTGTPVAPGELGEVLVTTFNNDYPLIRFATGDISAVLPGESPCGRTNARIVGWRGRADQATKVKGMFVRPEQVAQIVARHDTVSKARVTVTAEDGIDAIHVALEATDGDAAAFAADIREILKLRAAVDIVAPGSLPNDGKVIDDQRDFS